MKRLSNAVRFAAVVITGFFVVGCAADNKEPGNCEYLSEAIKTNARPVSLTEISDMEDFLFVRNFFIYEDTIAVVCNKTNNQVPYIQIYDLKNDRILKELIYNGNGPDEMLSCVPHLNRNILSIVDFVKRQYVEMNLDSLLSDQSYKSPMIKYKEHSHILAMTCDGDFIFANPFCFSDERYGIDNVGPRLVKGTQESNVNLYDKYEHNTENITSGFIIYNNQKNRVIYASAYYPFFEMYDTGLVLQKTVKGPDELEIHYSRDEYDDYNSWCFTRYIPYTYFDYCCNEDYFFLLYVGKTIDVLDYNLYSQPCYIFQFDWDGNLVESFYSERFLYTISCNENNTLYATAFNDDELRVIVKLEY